VENHTEKLTIKQFKQTIDILNPTMDNYLYLYDLKHDYYCISENALSRFRIPAREFYNVTEIHREFVYPADFEILQESLGKICRKEEAGHDLLYRWVSKTGEPIWINCRGSVILDKDGEPEFLVGCINEVGMRQKADNISNLLGEFSLWKELESYEGKKVDGFILRFGVDNFKEINEDKGVKYGNMILRRTAECIQKVILPGQKLYRAVADEFIVLDFTGRSIETASKIYRQARKKIDQLIEENQYEVFFTISAGILKLDSKEEYCQAQVMKWSEFALNEAKKNGKNTYYIFEKAEYQKFCYKKELIHMMRQSITHDFEGFEAYFQPIIDIGRNKLYSAETLLRFHSKTGEVIPPSVFIPLLEESGLIIPVGKWVFEQAVSACEKVQEVIPDFKVSVNLSYIQVLKSNVLKEILECMEKYRLKPGSIIIELTESGLLESNTNFTNFCKGLERHNIPLALDDFGTGYSNFHYLYNLNPATIKIDRTFTLRALNNDYEYGLLQHIVNMVHSIHLRLCIEGIETENELNKISGISPDFIQGYYFGKPCPLDLFLSKFASGGNML